jgi:hypothetical protein
MCADNGMNLIIPQNPRSVKGLKEMAYSSQIPLYDRHCFSKVICKNNKYK